MADNFGLKIGIEGEKEFKKALSDINQSFKVLGSEMKLVESEFSGQEKSVQSLTAKNEVLNKQITEQREKVSTLEKALANASASFGENDRRTQAWAVQLNNAKADLNNMERELEGNEKALDSLGDEMDSTGKSADKLGNEMEQSGKDADDAGNHFSALGDIVAGVGAAMAVAFAAVSAAAVAAGKALVNMSTAGAAYADGVITTSTQTGIATDKLQEYMYAAELVDVSVDTLTKSMAKQIKSMNSASEGSASFADAYARLGVSVTNADGSLRDSDTVYWELIESLGNVENETERDALAMTLLGKSAQELNPLIEAGADRMAELGEQARAAGYVMSDELLNAYGALDDQIQYLSVGAEAAKNALGTVLLPVLTDLAGEGVSLLGEFTNGILAANGDISKIADVIGDVLPKALDAIMQYVPTALTIIGEIVGALGQAVVDNLPTLVDAAGQIVVSLLEGMIAALPQITEGALQLVLALTDGLVENLPLIVEAGIEMIATLATGIAEALPSLVPALVQAIVYICQTLVENIDLIIQAALSLISGLAQGLLEAIPVLLAAVPTIIASLVDTLLSSIPEIIQTGITLLAALVEALPDIISAIVAAISEIIDGIVTAFLDNIPLIIQAGIDLLIALVQALPEIITTIVAAIPQIISSVIDAIVGNIPLLVETGVQLFVALIANLPTIIVEVVKAIPQIIASIVKAIVDSIPQIVTAGTQLIQGLWQGISDAGEWLWNQISGFFGGVVDRIKDFFGIHSPSTVFAEMGGYMAEGLGAGFSDEMGSVGDEMTSATAAAGDSTGAAALSAIRDGLMNNMALLDEPIAQLVARIGECIAALTPDIVTIGKSINISMTQGLEANRESTIISFFRALYREIVALFNSFHNGFVQIGQYMMEGIGQGITSRSQWLNNLVSSYIAAIIRSVEAMLDIHSPSKVFGRIGGYMAEGLGEGFTAEMDKVTKDIQSSIPTEVESSVTTNLTGNIVNGMVGGLSSFLGSSGNGQPIVLQVVLDSKTIAQTIFDPLRDVSRQRGVALG